MTELERATTDELIAELHARCPTIVFISLNDRDADSEQYELRWYGSHTTCLGMLRRAERRVLQHVLSNDAGDT